MKTKLGHCEKAGCSDLLILFPRQKSWLISLKVKNGYNMAAIYKKIDFDLQGVQITYKL